MTKIKFSKEQFEKCKRPLINYLRIENELNWYHLREVTEFIHNQSHLFTTEEIVELLTIAISNDRFGFTKYTKVIEALSKALVKSYPDFKLSNDKLINTAVIKGSSEDGKHENYGHLIPLLNACNEECKEILYRAFEKYLDKDFQADFYEELLRHTDYNFTKKDYFDKYVHYVNTQRGRAYDFGKERLSDLIFINFALVIYIRDIDFGWVKSKNVMNLNSFEEWLINPFEFNYENFNVRWLVEIESCIVLNKLKGNKVISEAIDKELRLNFQSDLAEIKYRYFSSLIS
jgi:hypothetical protein